MRLTERTNREMVDGLQFKREVARMRGCNNVPYGVLSGAETMLGWADQGGPAET